MVLVPPSIMLQGQMGKSRHDYSKKDKIKESHQVLCLAKNHSCWMMKAISLRAPRYNNFRLIQSIWWLSFNWIKFCTWLYGGWGGDWFDHNSNPQKDSICRLLFYHFPHILGIFTSKYMSWWFQYCFFFPCIKHYTVDLYLQQFFPYYSFEIIFSIQLLWAYLHLMDSISRYLLHCTRIFHSFSF